MTELFIELLIELLAEPLLTLFGRAFGALLPRRWQGARGLTAFGYLLLGAVAGALSLLCSDSPVLFRAYA